MPRGAGARYVNECGRVAVPPPVVTDTSTTPAMRAGDSAVIEVELTTVKDPASASPNLTDAAPERFVPEIVTNAPPAASPEVGDTEVMVGASVVKVNALGSVAVPPVVVTVSAAAPAGLAGVTARSVVALTTEKDVAGVPLNDTDDAFVRLVPVTVTVVPPFVDPLLGLTDVTAGVEPDGTR
jgi:hypothetical protein